MAGALRAGERTMGIAAGEAAPAEPPRAYSTRACLVALALVLLLPVFTVGGLLAHRYVAAERQRLEQAALDLARVGAAVVDREMAGLTAALNALSTSPSLADGDLGAFHRQAVAVGGMLDANVGLRNLASQQIVNSSIPWGQPLPNRTSLRAQDEEALRTGAPVVSDYFVGIADQRPSVAVVVPVSRNGEVFGFLSGSISTRRIRDALGTGLGPVWRTSATDRKGVVITRTQDPDANGRPAVNSFLAATVGRDEGFWRGSNIDGVPYFAAFHRTESGWIIGSGGPDAELRDVLDRVLAWTLAGALALVGVAVGAAFAIARGISRPFSALAGLGTSLGRGEPVPPVAFANREANEVARSLAEASVRLRRHEAHRSLLIDELNHRVKNTLAIVQSIASQTLRNAGAPVGTRETLQARLIALAQAHDLLTRESWSSVDLHDLVAGSIRAHGGDARFRTGGPAIPLPPNQALALAMALHELATNAAKHGALSREAGGVTIRWSVATDGPPRWRLTWTEHGGPGVVPPERRGFGSRLIEHGLAADLGGEVRLDFAPAGVVCTIEAPLETAGGRS